MLFTVYENKADHLVKVLGVCISNGSAHNAFECGIFTTQNTQSYTTTNLMRAITIIKVINIISINPSLCVFIFAWSFILFLVLVCLPITLLSLANVWHAYTMGYTSIVLQVLSKWFCDRGDYLEVAAIQHPWYRRKRGNRKSHWRSGNCYPAYKWAHQTWTYRETILDYIQLIFHLFSRQQRKNITIVCIEQSIN